MRAWLAGLLLVVTLAPVVDGASDETGSEAAEAPTRNPASEDTLGWHEWLATSTHRADTVDPIAGPVRVAVIDSGIDLDHPEFSDATLVGWKDWIHERDQPYDDEGHGTAVASRVAGTTLGGHPEAELLIAKVLDEDNSLESWYHVAQAIEWAIEHDADVITVSIWSSIPQPQHSLLTIGGAIERAHDAGILVVWIAGNGGDDIITPNPTPASLLVGASSSKALIVGAADADGERARFSQIDPEVLAWGASVPVARPGGAYRAGFGTSYAAPTVAGYAAAAIADGAPRDPQWLEWVLLHCAHDDPAVGYAEEGYGFLGTTGGGVRCVQDVARGVRDLPPLDERDVWHGAATSVRTATSATAPAAVLPPA